MRNQVIRSSSCARFRPVVQESRGWPRFFSLRARLQHDIRVGAHASQSTCVAWLPAYTDRHDIWRIDSDTVRYLGLALFVVGSVLRVGAVFVLGRRFSGLVAIQEGHQLETGGLYRVIRHPSYLGLLLGLFGWALVFRSAIGVLVALLLLPPLVARMNAEEALLESEFGERYADYRRRTWRLVPYLY